MVNSIYIYINKINYGNEGTKEKLVRYMLVDLAALTNNFKKFLGAVTPIHTYR